MHHGMYDARIVACMMHGLRHVCHMCGMYVTCVACMLHALRRVCEMYCGMYTTFVVACMLQALWHVCDMHSGMYEAWVVVCILHVLLHAAHILACIDGSSDVYFLRGRMRCESRLAHLPTLTSKRRSDTPPIPSVLYRALQAQLLDRQQELHMPGCSGRTQGCD